MHEIAGWLMAGGCFGLAVLAALDRRVWHQKAKERLDKLIAVESERETEREQIATVIAQVHERLVMCEDCPWAREIFDERAIAIAEGQWWWLQDDTATMTAPGEGAEATTETADGNGNG